MLSGAKNNQDTVRSLKTCLGNVEVGYRTLNHKHKQKSIRLWQSPIRAGSVEARVEGGSYWMNTWVEY